MSENWKDMIERLRTNQEKNLGNYRLQKEKNDERIKLLNAYQDSQEAVVRAGRVRR